MNDTILVTGGAGFIGSNFVRFALTRTGARVVVVDKLTYAGNLLNLEGVLDDPRLAFVRADIGDRTLIDDALREHAPAAVVNLAAETHVDRSIDNPRPFVDTNLVGTFELLRAVHDFWMDQPEPARRRFRFLHVSTDEVYGSLGATGAFSEEMPYAPNSPYAASKAGADHLVRAYHATYGLPTIITNCSNNYGPRQLPEKLIPLMILNAVEGRELPIYGDGGQVRDWLYVDDHCEGLLLVLERGRVGERYNIGGGGERTNREVVDCLCAALEAEMPAANNPALAGRAVPRYDALKKFVADRPGHDRRYAIDASKIRRELGWRPAHGFEAGIAQTVRWYLENRIWCEAVKADAHHRERRGLGAGVR